MHGALLFEAKRFQTAIHAEIGPEVHLGSFGHSIDAER